MTRIDAMPHIRAKPETRNQKPETRKKSQPTKRPNPKLRFRFSPLRHSDFVWILVFGFWFSFWFLVSGFWVNLPSPPRPSHHPLHRPRRRLWLRSRQQRPHAHAIAHRPLPRKPLALH